MAVFPQALGVPPGGKALEAVGLSEYRKAMNHKAAMGGGFGSLLRGSPPYAGLNRAARNAHLDQDRLHSLAEPTQAS